MSYQLSHATLSELYWQSLLKMFVLLGELSEASSERLASNPFTSTWHFLTKVPVGTGYVVEFATKLYEAVFKPLKPLISKELAVFLFHGRVFSQGGVQGVFTVL